MKLLLHKTLLIILILSRDICNSFSVSSKTDANVANNGTESKEYNVIETGIKDRFKLLRFISLNSNRTNQEYNYIMRDKSKGTGENTLTLSDTTNLVNNERIDIELVTTNSIRNEHDSRENHSNEKRNSASSGARDVNHETLSLHRTNNSYNSSMVYPASETFAPKNGLSRIKTNYLKGDTFIKR